VNDRYAANEFVLTIPRTGNQAQLGSDQVTDQFQSESEQPNNQITYKTGITSLKSEQPNIKLSQKQKDFQNFCSVPRTAKEIMDRLGLTDFYNNQME